MAEGLRFACQPGCTACCAEKGFVYLTAADAVRIAEYLGLRADEFEKRYCYRTRRQLRLRVPRAAQCHFLGDRGCSIHPVKPAFRAHLTGRSSRPSPEHYLIQASA